MPRHFVRLRHSSNSEQNADWQDLNVNGVGRSKMGKKGKKIKIAE